MFRLMKRPLMVLTFVGILSSSSISPQGVQSRNIACLTPENSATCYWTHGRLRVYNGGYPNFRLWKIGTDRLLGIYGGPAAYAVKDVADSDDHSELPPILDKYDFPKVSVFGDFEVCPLTPQKERHMQPACIEAVKNIVAK